MKLPAEETVPRHRTDAITWDSEPVARRRLLKSDFCTLCGKLLLRTKADARSYIGLLLSGRGHGPHQNAFTLKPYKCPHGKGWHVGRDRKVAELLAKGMHE